MRSGRTGKVWSVALALCFSVPALALESPDTLKWTPELSMKVRSVGGTAISLDGNQVAYTVRTPLMEGEKSEYLTHIWLASADGKTNFQFTRGEKSASSPAFSPDGRFLSFLSKRGKKTQVWIARVRGGEAMELTDAENGVSAYRWSPSGSHLAFTMRDPDSEDEKKAKKEKRDVILVDQNFKFSHLYVVDVPADVDGHQDAQRLTDGEFHVSGFDWAPDGKTLAFAHQQDPRINTGFVERDLSTVPADSGEVRPLVTWPGADSSPRYSPDGKWIAFISHGGTPQPVGLRDTYIVNPDGGAPSKLADTPDRNSAIQGWSADGKHLYVSEAARVSRVLYTLPVDGKAPMMMTKRPGIFSSFAVSPASGKIAYAWQDIAAPAEIYVSGRDMASRKQLSAVNSDLELPAVAKTEVVTWKSKDGLEIEGLLTYPRDYDAGRAYPLVLNVHGGPAGVYSRSYTGNPSIYMIETFAEQGFAVLRPNPRGSAGYGKEFRFANFKDWGYGDFEDLMAGVDKVVEMGVGHPDSLCLMGWSYGGYMTSFAVTKTARFKAASMGAGLPNLISMVSTTDIPDYLVAHMGSEFFDDYETYEKHSAIYRIKNVTTPTQVIHGANDLRVPFTQGQEFYVALSRAGVPTEMIVYPRTPHGPREPKFLQDVTGRILTWFEKHLKRKPEVLTNKTTD